MDELDSPSASTAMLPALPVVLLYLNTANMLRKCATSPLGSKRYPKTSGALRLPEQSRETFRPAATGGVV